MRLRLLCVSLSAALCLGVPVSPAQSASASAPAITLDEFLTTTDITDARISPDGYSAVIATESPDWKDSVYRHDLWLWTAQTGLRPLTHSGSEESPQWSPDGKWIAFLSDRALPGEAAGADGEPESEAAKANRLWLIPVAGGEALPLFSEKLDVHSFAWSADGAAIYYSVTRPLTHEQEEAQKTEWKDVIRWREQHRGDLLLKQPVAEALARALAVAPPESAGASKTSNTTTDGKKGEKADSATSLPAGAATIAKSDLSIGQITPSPDGANVVFATEPVHHRIENPADYELFLVPAGGGETRQMTHNEANESGLRWSPDSRWIYFLVPAASGSLEGKYRDVQGRLYRLDPATGKTERLGATFDGSFDSFTLLPDGRELALGLKGTEQQIYLVEGEKVTKLPGIAGAYAGLDAARGTSTLLFRHSAINQPTQAYLAADPLHPDHATALSSFNPIFAQRAQPEWQPYTWKSDDGRTVEGVLIFPPGKKDAKHLRMLTLIHGGPAEADGDRFGADWYDWATLAAANCWLVFRPNYRGSAGYGDDFMLEIEPHLVSKPGRDILTGVDALQGGANRRRGRGARRQLGQRRRDLGRRLVPGRAAVAKPRALPERSRAVPVRQGEDAHPSGAGRRGCARKLSGGGHDGAGSRSVGDSAHVSRLSRRRAHAGQESLARLYQGARRAEMAGEVCRELAGLEAASSFKPRFEEAAMRLRASS